MKTLPIHPFLRGLIALAYTAFMTLVLLQSSGQPVVGPPAPPGPPTLEREILLTVGHLVAFSLLTVLWTWTFYPRLSLKRALLLAVLIGFGLGFVTEIAQTLVPDRSASGFDMLVNAVSVLAVALFFYRRETSADSAIASA